VSWRPIPYARAIDPQSLEMKPTVIEEKKKMLNERNWISQLYLSGCPSMLATDLNLLQNQLYQGDGDQGRLGA